MPVSKSWTKKEKDDYKKVVAALKASPAIVFGEEIAGKVYVQAIKDVCL